MYYLIKMCEVISVRRLDGSTIVIVSQETSHTTPNIHNRWHYIESE